MPGVYEYLEDQRIKYAIRLPGNRVLERRFVWVTGGQLSEKLDYVWDDSALQLFQMIDDGVLYFSRKVALKDGDEE